jgi:hypothetical protein
MPEFSTTPPGGDRPPRPAYEAELEQLRGRWPGWRCWVVPRLGAAPTWHCCPDEYPYDADSAAGLEARMAASGDQAAVAEGAAEVADALREAGVTGRALDVAAAVAAQLALKGGGPAD